MHKLSKKLVTFFACVLCLGVASCTFPTNGGGNPDDPGEPEIPPRTRADDYNDIQAPYREFLPRLDIRNSDGSMTFANNPTMDSEKPYSACSISVSNCEDEYLMSNVSAQIKVRGNATANYPKKPFRIKFDKKQTMLGINNNLKAKSWVLLADYKDASMLRNAISLFLGQKLLKTDQNYCSDFAPVEVYINNQYWGVYLLVEQQQIHKGRFDIQEAPEGYEGTDIGYVIEYDGYAYREEAKDVFQISYHNNGSIKNIYGNNVTNSSRQNRYFTIKSDFYTTAQHDFIKQYTEATYNILYEAAINSRYYKFTDDYRSYTNANFTSVEETVRAAIDVQSLVDMYVLNEIACDLDVDWSSFYMSVDHSGTGDHKMHFQGPWDFDSCYALRDINSDGTGLRAANSPVNAWLVILQPQAWFQQLIKDKWIELRKYNVLKDTLHLISSYHTLYNNSYMSTYSRWPGCLGGLGGEQRYPLNTYTTHTQWADNLYDWAHRRFNYLNTLWGDSIDVLEDYQEPPEPIEEPTGDLHTYRYEAENGYLINCSIIAAPTASNGYCIGELFGTIGLGFEISFYSNIESTAKIRFCMVQRTYDHTVNEWYTLTVNQQNVAVPAVNVPGIGSSYNAYSNWYSADVTNIRINSGYNTIRILTANEHAANFDYIELITTASLT